jgi:hypothetical protein
VSLTVIEMISDGAIFVSSHQRPAAAAAAAAACCLLLLAAAAAVPHSIKPFKHSSEQVCFWWR